MPITCRFFRKLNGCCVPEGDILISEMNGSLLEAVIHFQPSNYCLVPKAATDIRNLGVRCGSTIAAG
jgi:hypothetical protein